MSLAAGARLGPYEIISLLGSGGMGDVYRARDTRLGRLVAVKTLRPDLSGSRDARERFEREARAISTLSHPNVCAIHDVGHADGIEFLVMEFLDGETLASRIAKGALPTADLLRFGIQIADALAAAHRHAIVHRDLKPGNVMVMGNGVKLLDFGLAKALEPAAAEGVADPAAMTAATELTQHGTILGTAPYMSPEQIQGKQADARSDVFALGSVLYEMATGRRAFPGHSTTEVAAAILHQEPPAVSSVRPSLPSSTLPVSTLPLAFDRLVRDCLVKNPENRWQSAHDVSLQLTAIDEGLHHDASTSGLSVVAGAAGRHTHTPTLLERTSLAAWALALVAIVTTAGLWWQRTVPEQTAAPGRMALQVLPPPAGSFLLSFEAVSFALSPDGSRLAFIGADPGDARRIWIRPLASLDATPVAGTSGAEAVFWSPDGQSVGFFADGALKRLDLASGAAVTVCSVPKKDIGISGAWSADGHILFASTEGDAIYRVEISGGDPTVVVKPDRSRNEWATKFPSLLPNGRRFLYLLRMADNTGALMIGEPGKPSRRVMPVDSNAAFVNGALVFARDGALVGQRFDPDTGTVAGDAFAIAKSVRFLIATGTATFAASPSGAIVYQAERDRARIAWVDRGGQESPAIDAPGNYLELRLARSRTSSPASTLTSSPGGLVAVASRALPSTGAFDIWRFDLDRRTQTRLTHDDRLTEISPLLLPGGDTLIFSITRDGPPRMAHKDLATGKEASFFPPATVLQGADDVSPDGSTLAYEERTERGNYNLWTMPIGGGTPTRLRESASNEFDIRFSPDGKSYSFTSNESGIMEVYVSPIAGGARTAVSNGGARLARWTRDGRELVYLTRDRRLVTVPVRTAPTLELGTPTTLFAVSKAWLDFDVAPDGKRFLAVIPELVSNDQPLTAIVGWNP